MIFILGWTILLNPVTGINMHIKRWLEGELGCYLNYHLWSLLSHNGSSDNNSEIKHVNELKIP